MKHFLLPCLVLLTALSAIAQIAPADYVATWKTDNSGTSNPSQITIPATGEYTIYYESIPAGFSGVLPAAGTYTGVQTLTFPGPGTYRVAIKPAGTMPFHRIRFDASGDCEKLLTIEQWGTTPWSDMSAAYAGCVNLTAISATDTPVLGNVTSMANAFNNCRVLAHAPLMPAWNVGSVTVMAGMFQDAREFNVPIGTWNVGNVTDMSNMFAFARFFNQPLNDWNVGNVVDMHAMFFQASAFNQPLNNWNVGKVTDMHEMFAFAGAFNGVIGNWNVSNVVDMHAMFTFTTFNQALANWDVGKVTNMNSMFSWATIFDQPIGSWNVSSVTDMSSMFYGAIAFNQPIGSWNTGNVTQMAGMFASASAFNQPLENWNVSNVTDMNTLFAYARAFNQPLNNWNTGSVTDMSSMFLAATSFNRPLNHWDIGNAGNLSYLLFGASAYNQSLADWTLNPEAYLAQMLTGSGMDCNNYSTTLMGWAANSGTPPARSLGAAGRTYGPAATAARDYLVNTLGWTISGDNLDVNCTVLPVRLVSFSAMATPERMVKLVWETTEEMHNERFVVQRSKDLTAFEDVAEIREVAGNSNTRRVYRALDPAPYSGTGYYRLLQVDLDGSRTYSKLIAVVVRTDGYTLYPNPLSQPAFRISLDEPASATISLHGMTGNAIAFNRIAEGSQTVLITPTAPLVPGTYLVTVRERATQRTYTMVVP